MRQYKIRPGERDAWVEFMETEIIPYQASKGMVIVGSFVGQEEDDLYVWMRRFESEDEMERLYKAVYQTDHWKSEIAPRVAQMLDGQVVTRMEPTPKSVIR